MKYPFPKDFLWGASVAAYQVEGGNRNSDWWEIEKKIEPTITESNGADHYNRFREDYTLSSNLSLNAQRLSLEWSRVEPKEGVFDQKEIAHYGQVLKFLKDKNVKVFLTLHHFSNPLWFEETGGWQNIIKARKFFSRYVEVCTQEFSSLIDGFITINEPNLYAGMYPLGTYAAKGRLPLLTVVKTFGDLLTAHVTAYKTIKKMRPEIPVGLSGNFALIHPFDGSIFSNIASLIGNYFGVSQLSFVFQRYADFIGLNYYYNLRARFNLLNPRSFYELYNGQGLIFSQGTSGTTVRFNLSDFNSGPDFSDLGWETYPSGIYEVLRELRNLKKPIYITENGIADAADTKRERYIKDHLYYVWKAIQEGIDVRGYFYWSLIDNFEWFQGYAPRFGLIEVDYKTKERRVRPSAHSLAQTAKTNCLEF